MKKLKLSLIMMLILGILGYACGVAINYFLNDATLTQSLMGSYAFMGAGIGVVLGIGVGMMAKNNEGKDSNSGKTTEGEKFDIAFESKFATDADLKASKALVCTTFDQLPDCNKTGFVFRHKINHGKYEIDMKPESHALVLGTTGTGKTQLLAVPTIRALAHSGQKPSFVMTDPKNELYLLNAEALKKEGYKIIVLNLNDPYSSSKWNPMEPSYRLYKRAEKLNEEVKKISSAQPEDVGYKRLGEDKLNGETYGDTWYGFEGIAYPNIVMLKTRLAMVKRQLESEAKDKLKNIALALIPENPNAKEKTWDDGSRDFLTGIMTAMLEDTRDPELGMTLEKFNFYNLYRILNIRDPAASERDSVLKTLGTYAEGRDEIEGNVKALMGTVCFASPVTQRSYLSTLGASIGKILGDEGILYMTSGTDINFEDLVNQPTAFFIRIPDHKTERHPLGVLCVTQLYSALVDIANRPENAKGGTGKLPRPTYFILDEFGNMPAFPGFGTMVTVARSRNIFFEIVLQSYSQLDIKYGAEEAKNIKGNFQTELFLGSEDMATVQAFSDACGEITVLHEEESVSKNSKSSDGGDNITKSVQRTRRPLIDKQELRQSPKWTIVAKLFGEKIVKDVMTPFFDNKFLEKKNAAEEVVAYAEPLDYQKIAYDVKRRNALRIKSSAPPRPNFF